MDSVSKFNMEEFSYADSLKYKSTEDDDICASDIYDLLEDKAWLEGVVPFTDIHKKLGLECPEEAMPMACPIIGMEAYQGAWIESDEGQYIFNVFHAGKTSYTLVDLYANHITNGAIIKLETKGERGIWLTRLLFDIGYLDLPECEYAPLPTKYAPEAHQVYAGFILALQCHKHHTPATTYSCFSIDFATAWCGISESKFRKWWQKLQHDGYIEKVRDPEANVGEEKWLMDSAARASYYKLITR